MGRVFRACCKDCNHAFEASDAGGGFSFVEFRCDKCGGTKAINCPDLRTTQAKLTPEQELEWERSREELSTMDLRCPCGGEFRADAPLRCPQCGSTDIAGGDVVLFYD